MVRWPQLLATKSCIGHYIRSTPPCRPSFRGVAISYADQMRRKSVNVPLVLPDVTKLRWSIDLRFRKSFVAVYMHVCFEFDRLSD